MSEESTTKLDSDPFWEGEFGQGFLRVVESNMKAYLAIRASSDDLLREAAWWKARSQLQEILRLLLPAMGGFKGGLKNNPIVREDRDDVELAIEQLVSSNAQVTAKAIKERADTIRGKGRQVTEGAVKLGLKRFNAVKKSKKKALC